MKENTGRLFKSKGQFMAMDTDVTFKLLDVFIDDDGDECCSIEWVEDNTEHHMSRLYLDDVQYFFRKGIYYWI